MLECIERMSERSERENANGKNSSYVGYVEMRPNCAMFFYEIFL